MNPFVEVVTDSGGKYVLQSIIEKGGRGVCYTLRDQPDLVYKFILCENHHSRCRSHNIQEKHYCPGCAEVRKYIYIQEKKCDRIVRLLDVVRGKNHVGIVMERASMDLFTFIQRRSESDLADRATTNYIAREMILAVEGLHKAGVIHRDIKPENFLVFTSQEDSRPVIKLCDFELCLIKSHSRDLSIRERVGTSSANPPEINFPHEYSATKIEWGEHTDVWSLSVALFTVCTGFFPFCWWKEPKAEGGYRLTTRVTPFTNTKAVKTIKQGKMPKYFDKILSKSKLEFFTKAFSFIPQDRYKLCNMIEHLPEG